MVDANIYLKTSYNLGWFSSLLVIKKGEDAFDGIIEHEKNMQIGFWLLDIAGFELQENGFGNKEKAEQ
jgi:hypothetical protein